MHRHRPRRHDQPLPPPLQRTVRGLATVRRSGPGIRTSSTDTSSARNIPDNQRLTQTACSPLAARGFCITLVFSTLPGRALTQKSTVAGMYDLRRLQIKRCGRLGVKAVLALACCPMCHSLPPGSPKRFQNRTGFIAGTAVSSSAPSPAPTPAPLQSLLYSLPSSLSRYLQTLSGLLSPIEKSCAKPLPATPLTINNLLKPRAAKGEHAVRINH